MDNPSEISKMDEELIKISEPDTLQNDGGKLRARFYLDDLAKKIYSEKMLMKDKVLEEIIRMIENERKGLF